MFPDKFKEAIITPCFKKSTLDSLDLASYRPDRRSVIMVMLDLKSAFDTIDH